MSYSSTILATSGLVGYYRLNETGSAVAMTGTSVLLGGGDISLPNRSLAKPCTLELWIYPTSLTADTRLASGTSHCGVRITSAGDIAWLNSSPGFNQCAPAGTIVVNTWHHLVFVVESTGKVSCYVNGRLVGHTTTTNNSALDEAIKFGAKYLGSFGNTYAGNIHKVAYYSAALTQAQVIANYQAVQAGTYDATVLAIASLDSFWKLNDSSGTTVVDSGSGAHSGTYEGTFTLAQSQLASVLPPSVDSNGGSSAFLSGSLTRNVTNAPGAGISDKVVTFAGGQLQLPSGLVSALPFSLECWLYPTTVANDRRFFVPEADASISNQVEMSIDALSAVSTRLSVYANSGWKTVASIMTASTWHHLVLTVDGSGNGILYADGAAVTPTESLASAGNPLAGVAFFGAALILASTQVVSGSPYLGDLSNISVYSAALSSGTVAAHYSAGITRGGGGANGGGGGNPHGGGGGGSGGGKNQTQPGGATSYLIIGGV